MNLKKKCVFANWLWKIDIDIDDLTLACVIVILFRIVLMVFNGRASSGSAMDHRLDAVEICLVVDELELVLVN